MSRLWDLNLIRFFDFYLATVFVLSLAQRARQYSAILSLVGKFPGRWPRLLALVKHHKSLFLTWSTLAPALLALILMLIQLLASRYIWPAASVPRGGLTLGLLFEHFWAVPVVALFGLGMLAVDLYFVLVVSPVDQGEIEKYFDQAEYWLRSWVAPVVNTVTFGFINPRRMVHAEVQSALTSASQQLNETLWWVVLQVALRVAYGLSLWFTYALSRAA